MLASGALEMLRASAPTISIGILSADLLNLASDIALLEQTGARLVHFDVMDGCFVPAMTAGPPLVRAVRTRLLKDVHLMIRDPLEKVMDYVHAGADIITVHLESSEDIRPVLQRLRTAENENDPERGLIRGIALNPGTPAKVLEPLLDDAELIVVLAVDPAVRGQSFLDSTKGRFAEIKEMISAAKRELLLCIDGGVKRSNIAEIATMGADIVVSGSAIFDQRAPVENARFMLETVKSKRV